MFGTLNAPDEIVIIISLLNALEEDQAKHFQAMGISAAAINGDTYNDKIHKSVTLQHVFRQEGNDPEQIKFRDALMRLRESKSAEDDHAFFPHSFGNNFHLWSVIVARILYICFGQETVKELNTHQLVSLRDSQAGPWIGLSRPRAGNLLLTSNDC
ncbi:hypothetical protein B0H13DRAFT_1851580 [Mycena leptocephala]|nr:hypothetical protein B0H13DRAFT_1851580 [Mycena leptocephala]